MTVCQGSSSFTKRARFTDGLDFATGRPEAAKTPDVFAKRRGSLYLSSPYPSFWDSGGLLLPFCYPTARDGPVRADTAGILDGRIRPEIID
jgi:hypothetical protein